MMATLVAEKAARKKKERLIAEAKPEENSTETTLENVVMFTSWDGTVREVGPLPANLGRATALASEKSVSKVWGTSEEEKACRAMQKEK